MRTVTEVTCGVCVSLTVVRKALLPYFGLHNILAGEFIVPELLQQDATPANLAQALGNWLDNKAAREQLQQRFARLHASLACGHDERLRQALAPFLTRATEHAAVAGDADHHRAAVRG